MTTTTMKVTTRATTRATTTINMTTGTNNDDYDLNDYNYKVNYDVDDHEDYL